MLMELMNCIDDYIPPSKTIEKYNYTMLAIML